MRIKVKENIISNKTFKCALRIIDVYRELVNSKKEFVISIQLLRSGTSINANVNEAIEAQLKADFIHKLSIALKEARETEYWIKLLIGSDYLNSSSGLNNEICEIIKILTTIIKTAKDNQK